MTASDRPNIVLIHSDQHRYDCIAAHGIRPEIRTPNLDALCAAGTSFSRAHCTIPICTPARASLLTGTWPSRHGSFCIPQSELYRPAKPQLPLLSSILKEAGYRTAWTGKYHSELEHEPGPANGFEKFVASWAYKAYRQNRGLPPEPSQHGLFGEIDSDCPPEDSALAWQANTVLRQLEERCEGPFFIRWDPPEPHLPSKPTQSFADFYDPSTIAPWRSWPDPLDNKPQILHRQRRIWGVEGWLWEHWQPIVHCYYGIISELDFHIGRVLARLDQLGVSSNTLVIYSTDHGDYCGGHGMIDKHFNLYDDVVHVPLILRWPGRVPAGNVCEAFASNSIDITRTIAEAAGLTVPESFQGEDLIRMAADPSHRPRTAGYVQYFGTQSGAYSMRMVQDDRYKFVYHPTGSTHELYDLAEDPGELKNLISNPALADVLTNLKNLLAESMTAAGDGLANSWVLDELRGAPSHAERSAVGPYAQHAHSG